MNKKERHQPKVGVKRRVGERDRTCIDEEKYLCHLLSYDYSSLKKLVAICAADIKI